MLKIICCVIVFVGLTGYSFASPPITVNIRDRSGSYAGRYQYYNNRVNIYDRNGGYSGHYQYYRGYSNMYNRSGSYSGRFTPRINYSGR